MTWIGVDLGTQSVRAVRADETGVLASTHRPLTSRWVGAQHEQDPRDWLVAVDAVVAEVGDGGVEGISICSTSGTVLLTDGKGRPVGPALMYDDARAADRVDEIVAADPERWQSVMQPTWALPKVLWLEPKEHRIAHSADVVAAYLVGHPVATDTSHVLKTGYDLVADRWPTEAFERLGLHSESLPPVVLPGAELGRLDRPIGAVPRATPVYAGMTDGCAAQIAAGALSPGDWNSVLGTTLVLKGVSDQLLHDPSGAVYSHRHPDGGWLPGGASSSGAGVLTELLPGADLDAFDRAAHALGPIDAVLYPLTTRGERFPFVAPTAERFQLGDVPDELQLYAAVLQGVAFVERLAFEHLVRLGAEPVRRISLTGGAVRSSYWNQLRADVLAVSAELPAVPDPAYGMAILAAAAGTGVGVAPMARGMVRVDRVIEPRPNVLLDDLYQRFVDEVDRRGYRG